MAPDTSTPTTPRLNPTLHLAMLERRGASPKAAATQHEPQAAMQGRKDQYKQNQTRPQRGYLMKRKKKKRRSAHP